MDYTREPILESVISSREGCKLVIRSSKGNNQEEYFVDAVELVTFGTAQFFRSLEKPKPFLLPVQDYEILEVREPRMVLKNVGVDRSIKIGPEKKAPQPKKEPMPKQEPIEAPVVEEKPVDDRKRQRRSNRRRGKPSQEGQEEQLPAETLEEGQVKTPPPSPSAMSALLAPPTTLISETLSKYRSNDAFKQAFYEREQELESLERPPAEPFIATDEEFDEGDHIIFRGHETASDFKPFTEEESHSEEQPQESQIEEEERIEESSIEIEELDESQEQPIPFEDRNDQL